MKPPGPQPVPAASLADPVQNTRENKAQRSPAAADFALALQQRAAADGRGEKTAKPANPKPVPAASPADVVQNIGENEARRSPAVADFVLALQQRAAADGRGRETAEPAGSKPAPAESPADAGQKPREKKTPRSPVSADLALALGQQLERFSAKAAAPGQATAPIQALTARLLQSVLSAAWAQRGTRSVQAAASPTAGPRGRDAGAPEQQPAPQLPRAELRQPRVDQGAPSAHTVALSTPATEPTASPVWVQDIVALAPTAAPLSAQAAQDASLKVAVLPHAAHIEMDTGTNGELSLHLRVREGVAEISVTGAAAPLLEARAPELGRSLAGEGLALGRFDLTHQGEQHVPPEVPAAPSGPGTPPAGPASFTTEPTDERQGEGGLLHITA